MKVSDDVRATHSPDGAILLNIRHGQMFRLNLVGSRILELLKQGHSEEEIATEVSQQFAVARDVVVTDLREFLAQLVTHRLVEPPSTAIPSLR